MEYPYTLSLFYGDGHFGWHNTGYNNTDALNFNVENTDSNKYVSKQIHAYMHVSSYALFYVKYPDGKNTTSKPRFYFELQQYFRVV